MGTNVDHGEYGLLVLIEQLQREGRSENEIEAAVREAADDRTHHVRRLPARRPSRFELMVWRSLT